MSTLIVPPKAARETLDVGNREGIFDAEVPIAAQLMTK
jgi:hypothetical protein